MNRKRQQPTGQQESQAETPVPGTVSTGRLWLMRAGAMVVVPLLALGALELSLRLAGYGYPTDFFLPARIEGRDFYVSNPKFGYRFFPPALARPPLPLRMAAQKSSGTYRIFLFGESAAYGDPDPSYGVGRYLQVLLHERYPETQFEVVCVAVTAINSHVILPLARECAHRQGDLWVIYMGNNEMIGPFGGATILNARAPSLGLIRASLAARTTKIGQLMEALVLRFGGSSSTFRSWGGMKMFRKHKLSYDDPNRLRTYERFGRNLEDILRAGRQAGVPIILSTVASNLKDCGPFASLHGAAMHADQQATWETLYQQGIALEGAGSYRQALDLYSQAAGIDPQYADLQFRIGNCHLALTNSAAARRDFELARDCDAMAIRTDTRLNQIIKDSARRHASEGVHLLDATEVFSEHSPAGIPGEELFLEHVHLNFEGNYLLARAFAGQIVNLLPPSVTARSGSDWATAELCDRRLAATAWDRLRIWKMIRNRLQEQPYTDESDNATLVKLHEAESNEINSRMNTQSPEQARDLYQQALALAPEDNLLHANFAQFLEAGGYLTEAIDQVQRVHQLLPQIAGPYFYLGTLLVRTGRTGEAAGYFARAIALQGDYYPQALNEQGLILANQREPAKATAYFMRALRADPDDVDAYLNLGFLELSQRNLDRALIYYRQAAQLQPQGPADFFSRAVAQAGLGRHREAIDYFRTLLPYAPELWQARYLFGVELATQADMEDAQAQFAEVIRYRPDYAPAHLDLAVILARQGKPDQALEEFRTVLRLDPGNTLARQQIENLQAPNSHSG